MLTFIIVSNYKSYIEFPQKNLAIFAKLLYLNLNLLSITFFSKNIKSNYLYANFYNCI